MASVKAGELGDAWSALMQAEQAAVLARRRKVLDEAPGSVADDDQAAEGGLPRVGLALSGGGVRSATFALGLMRGMAENHRDDAAGPVANAHRTLVNHGLLGRLDYLSTVSGGGYTGGMFGRLVSTYGMRRAQALMADSASPVLEWLRRNGRYLSPGGSRDYGIAAVTYLRALLAIHAEFMVACLLLGLVVLLPHLWQHTTQVLNSVGWQRWQTPWWVVALAFWMATAPGLIAGYWAARDAPNPGGRAVGPALTEMLFLLGGALAAYALVRALLAHQALNPVRDGLNSVGAAVLALMSLLIGQATVQGVVWLSPEPYALSVARVRNHLTAALRVVTLGALAILGMGALDVVSWWVLEELQAGNDYVWSGLGLGGLLALSLRTMAQPLQQMASDAGGHARDWWPRLVDLGGLFGLLALVMGWLVLMQWFVFAPDTFRVLINTPAWMRAAMVASVWFLWVLLTAGNAQMPNTSSLHSFYRARLTRAYLAVGNVKRRLADHMGSHSDVTSVVAGDDTGLSNYHPETEGGPIHLVNTSLNQTRDDESGLYNADRKGTAVTASWRGLELGPSQFIALKPWHDMGTLGRWVAISGAAASPGAGAYTSRGLALLLYFLGVRLGYWVKAPYKRVELRWLSRLGWHFLPKPLMLASEASATFFGRDRPWWYLSDGGHFENTGVYALLKRELDFIILSDASCDVGYQFGDLENLVRKARIDFGAEIDFYSNDEARRLFTLCGTELTVLSPEDMGDNHSCRGVLLARIRYHERPGPLNAQGRPTTAIRPEGTLLIVKPNLHNALDVDVLAYARKHEAFPHEPTSDQDFDEAQWESYHRLGEDFGKALNDTWLSQLPGWRSPAHHGIKIAARLREEKVSSAPGVDEPLWRRTARATAIGTTLGLGASGTLLLSLWQIADQVQRQENDARADAHQLFIEVSKGLNNFDATCAQVPEHVVTQAETLLLDLRHSAILRPLERAGVERLATRIAEHCTQAASVPGNCTASQQRVRNDLCALALKPVTENTALNYWHPGSSPTEQAHAAQAVLAQLSQVWQGWGAVKQGRSSAPPAVMPPSHPFKACQRAQGQTTLYLQIYDEASRLAANALRQTLQTQTTGLVQVAPIENVTRSAELRQQRRPAPWPQPTFVLHDPNSRACAQALSRLIGQPWVTSNEPGQVWIRELPDTLNRRPGVIELWMPESSSAASGS
ncbi:MAG: hypothetical protein KGL90_11970 [Burkholderiales bacterium]|nr:hypothetical protein [Burkholderiales bacterium]